jgi:proline iminopeptidase
MKLATTYLLLLFIISSCTSPEKVGNPYLLTEDGFIEVEGGKIWYGIMGEGDKTPLLQLHGGPGGKSNFKLSEISKERPVIIFDQLGNGRSDHHHDTSLMKVSNLIAQVYAVKTALKLKEFYLSGHSWGTALALEYYNKYPDGIQALIFNSPYFSTPIWTADADTLIAALPDSIQQIIRTAEADSAFNTPAYAAANTFFAKKHHTRTTKTAHPYDTIAFESDPFIYYYMWGPSEFTSTGTLRNYDIHQTLKDIKVPTLFTTGEFDEARPETIKTLSRLAPESDFVIIEGAGHGTTSDNLPALIASIKEFIKKLEQ